MRYAVCGPSGEYYCELPDGQKWCHDGAGDRFTSLIGKGTRKKTISRVAFGENDAWIVIFTNGACEWNGPVPEALVAAIRATDEAPTEVSLGSYGTFFVAFADGRTVCRAGRRAVRDALAGHTARRERVRGGHRAGWEDGG